MKNKLALIAIAVCLASALAGFAACSPQKAPTEPAEDAADAATSESAEPGTFTSYDAGVFSGSAHADDFMNAGNRGCNSCHADLYTAVASVDVNFKHLMAAGATYGKTTGIADCLPCHYYNQWAGGPRLSDPIHSMHYSNQEFADKGGNCWSCHATSLSGDIVLWDLYKYSDEFGGYKDVGSERTQDWISNMRGYEVDTIAGVTLEHDMALGEVAIDQHVTALDDVFSAVNSNVPEYDDSYRLEVSEGVNEPHAFTLDELKAKAITKTYTIACGTNAVNGFQVANVECTGILLKDVIDQCGGLAEGAVGLKCGGDDGWSKSFYVQDLLDKEAMLCFSLNGEPLSADQGYPLRIVVPGAPAATWVKYLSELHFIAEPAAHTDWYALMAKPDELESYKETGFNLVHSSWINPADDGATFKLGEPITLEGYAYACNDSGHKTQQIAFSADYGTTWTYVDVPADADPYQWAYFTVQWQPQKAGTYLLQCKTIDAGGYEQSLPASTYLTVEE